MLVKGAPGHLGLCYIGTWDHFMNDFSIEIQIPGKIGFSVTPL